jgi:hypothetical protein
MQAFTIRRGVVVGPMLMMTGRGVAVIAVIVVVVRVMIRVNLVD